MKLLSTLALLFALCGATRAATYYVSACANGADPACVPGNDSNPGTSSLAPLLTVAAAIGKFNAAAPGDAVLFARGGAFDTSAVAIFNATAIAAGSATNPITLGAYTPAWGGGTARPILRNASGTVINILDSGSPDPDGGYYIRDIAIIGMAGINLGNDAKYVTIDSVAFDGTTISGSSIGFQCEGGSTNQVYSPSDGKSNHIVVKNSLFKGWGSMGLYSTCSQLLVEGNTFQNNATTLLDHHMYLSSGGVNSGGTIVPFATTQVTVRGNAFVDNNIVTGKCTSSALVVHGNYDQITIEDNTFKESTTTGNGSCWGIDFSSGYTNAAESFNRVTVRGNTIINYALGIGLDSVTKTLVENNAVCSALVAGGIQMRSKGASAISGGNAEPDAVVIRNNFIYHSAPGQYNLGIQLAANIGDAKTGRNHAVTNNLIVFAAGSTSTTRCFNADNIANGSFSAFDSNACYFAGTQGQWMDKVGSLSAWQGLTASAGTQRDTNSLTSNPIVSPGATCDPSTGSGSPVRGAGNPTTASRLGFGRVLRGGVPDIGAKQAGATSVVPKQSPWTDIK